MATRGVKPGSHHPDAGRAKPRHKPQRVFDPIRDDPVRRALVFGPDSVFGVDADEWEELRVPVWIAGSSS